MKHLASARCISSEHFETYCAVLVVHSRILISSHVEEVRLLNSFSCYYAIHSSAGGKFYLQLFYTSLFNSSLGLVFSKYNIYGNMHI